MKDPQHILITGASSGIGAALAREYAAPGVVLGLAGRNAQRLEGVAASCRAKGAQVETTLFDVRDPAATRAWVMAAAARAPIDLVVANAGISAGTGGGGESEAQARDIFAVNLEGVLNTLHPALEAMRKSASQPSSSGRGQGEGSFSGQTSAPHPNPLPEGEGAKGQIALISSLASFIALPSAPAYSASKAAVRVYGDALAAYLKRSGIAVTVLCPGFIKTPMTDVNPYPMPFIMSAEDAARRMRRELEKGAGVRVFPRRLYWAIRAFNLLPWAIRAWMLGKAPGKPSH